MERILVIDDDRNLCESLEDYLSSEGFKVEIAGGDDFAIDPAIEEEFDLIVLDVMPPNSNGYNVLRQLRGRIALPIIITTTRDDDIDRIVGLELGADDCLSKPFNPRELLARIRAVLRRTKSDSKETAVILKPKQLQVGDVEMDLGAREAYRSGEKVELTSAEFSLLECLLNNAGELVLRETLTEEVLGRPLAPYDRSIDVHVSKLRKKLGNDIAGCDRIKAIRGEGYLYSLTPMLGQ